MSPEAAQLFSLFAAGVVLILLIGGYGLLVNRSLVRIIIAMEILTKGVTLLIITAGYAIGHTALAQALAITLIVIEVSVIVAAVGIVLCVYRHTESLDVAQLRKLKG